MLKNASGQFVGVQMVSASDGSAFAGSVTVYVTVDNGTQALGSVGSGVCTHKGNGLHNYAPSQAETNGNSIQFTFIGTGAIPQTIQFETLPSTGVLAPTTLGRTLDVSTGGEAGIDWANVGSPTSTVNLSGTTIATTQQVDVNTIKTRTITAGSNITVGAYVGGTAAHAVASTALSTEQWTNTLATNLGTTNTTVASNLNAQITSRMATYTQPAGFLAATFPTDPADQSLVIEATDAILTAVGTRLAAVAYTAPPSAATISNQVASDLATAHGAGSWLTATGFATAADLPADFDTLVITDGKVTAELDSASVTAVQSGLATASALADVQTDVDGANNYLSALSGIFTGITSLANWLRRGFRKDSGTAGMVTAESEINTGGTSTFVGTTDSLEAIRDASGGSGAGSATIEKQEEILEEIRTYASSMLATVDGSAATIVGFPETLVIGDSYTTDGSNAIHVFVRDSNDDPVTAVGTHEFTDSDFAPEVIITTSGRAGRVRASVTWVPGGSEGYLKIQIPLSESHRAAPGAATVQVVLKWTGCEKTIATQTVTWIPRI